MRENGVDLTLGEWIAVPKETNLILDPMNHGEEIVESLYKQMKIPKDGYVLHRGECVLAHTAEYVELPNYIVGLVNLKSSLARIGILIPPTVVDAGFKGQIVLELCSMHHSIRLRPGMPFAHLVFDETKSLVAEDYGKKGRYQGQTRVRLAKLPLDRFRP